MSCILINFGPAPPGQYRGGNGHGWSTAVPTTGGRPAGRGRVGRDGGVRSPAAAVAPVQAAATLDTVTNAYVYGCLRTNGATLYDTAAGKTFVTYSGTATTSTPRPTTTRPIRGRRASGWRPRNLGYHDYQVLKQLPDGRLTVFRAEHAVAEHRCTAPIAHPISGTWSSRRISTDRNGYPEPIFLGGTTHLVHGQNTDISYPYRTCRLITSPDSGLTWSAEAYAFGVT